MRPVAIVGPTGAGKSAAGTRLAELIGGEIVSIDSRQIYRGLDIGTAKPGADELRRVPHHLVDILDITERSNAAWFASLAREAIRDIVSRRRVPVLVGGSGLYLRAVIHGMFEIDLDPSDRERFSLEIGNIPTGRLRERLCEVDRASYARIHPNDRYRIVRALEVHALTGIPLSEHFRRQAAGGSAGEEVAIVGLSPPRGSLRAAIRARTVSMCGKGWPEEVRGLLERGADPACPGMKTLGYPEMIDHVRGKVGRKETIDRIAARTAGYAKRQMTWFRKERVLAWIDPSGDDTAAAVLNVLDRNAVT